MQKTIVVAAFIGIGKSHFIEKHKRFKITDIQSTDDHKKAIDELKTAISHRCRYAFVPLDVEFLKSLDDENISFYMMMPSKSRKTEIILSHYNSEVFDQERSESEVKKEIADLQNQWEGYYHAAQRYASEIGIKVLFLDKGQYLTDGMKTIEQLEKENV